MVKDDHGVVSVENIRTFANGQKMALDWLGNKNLETFKSECGKLNLSIVDSESVAKQKLEAVAVDEGLHIENQDSIPVEETVSIPEPSVNAPEVTDTPQ